MRPKAYKKADKANPTPEQLAKGQKILKDFKPLFKIIAKKAHGKSSIDKFDKMETFRENLGDNLDPSVMQRITINDKTAAHSSEALPSLSCQLNKLEKIKGKMSHLDRYKELTEFNFFLRQHDDVVNGDDPVMQRFEKLVREIKQSKTLVGKIDRAKDSLRQASKKVVQITKKNASAFAGLFRPASKNKQGAAKIGPLSTVNHKNRDRFNTSKP